MPKWRSRRLVLLFAAVVLVPLTVFPSNVFSQINALGGESPGFESLTRQATSAREQGRTEEAIGYYRQALQLRPDWEEGWFYVGTSLYDSNRCAEAIPAFAKVLELDPKLGPAWSFRGLCAFEIKDYSTALADLEKGHELGSAGDPELAKVAGYHLALALIRSGQPDRAMALLSSEFVHGQTPEQIQVALGLALLRVPLLPNEIDPSKDALVATAGGIAVLLAQHQKDQAFQAFDQALKDYPDIPYLHYAYGRALAAAGRYAEAQAQLREETRISPTSPLPYQALAEILRAAGKAGEASTSQAKATALSKEGPAELANISRLYARVAPANNTRTEPGKSEAPSGASGVGTAGFDELAKPAAAARDAGNLEEAVRLYQSALRSRPTWEEGWWNLSLIYFGNRSYAEAIEPLKRTVAFKPGFGTAWALLGLSEYETKDYKNALIHLDKAKGLGIQSSPEAIRIAQYHLGSLLNLNHEFDRAVELLSVGHPEGQIASQWNIALGMGLLRVPQLPEQATPAQQPVFEAAGRAAALLANSKYDDAFVILRKILQENPGTPFLHYAYGTALASLSQYDEAEAQMREEIKLTPDSALPYIRIAFIDLKTHRASDALAAAQQAVQLAPQSPEALYVLGRALLGMGNANQALKELQAANEMMLNSPEIHFHLARAYSKTNQPAEAERERETFARLNAIAERQRSLHGSQAYGASHEQQSDLSLPAAAATEPASSQQ